MQEAEELLSRTELYDKSLKLLSSSVRLYVWGLSKAAKRPGLVSEERLRATAAFVFPFNDALSQAKLVTRLGKWLRTLSELRDASVDLYETHSVRPIPARRPAEENPYTTYMWKLLDVVNCWLGLATDVGDDVFWLGKHGIVSPTVREFADEWATWLWYVTCYIDLAFALRAWRQKRTFVKFTSVTRFVGDLVVAYAYTRPDEGPSVSKGLVYSAALLSALSSLYQQWVKAKARAEAKTNNKR